MSMSPSFIGNYQSYMIYFKNTGPWEYRDDQVNMFQKVAFFVVAIFADFFFREVNREQKSHQFTVVLDSDVTHTLTHTLRALY